MRKIVLLVLILAAVASATTGHLIALKCPVCGTATQGTELFSTNNAAGVDRDLLERAGGGQPLLLQTVTCPKCHYSADESEFEKPVDPKLAEAVKAGQFPVPAFKTYPSGAFTEGLRAPDQPPAWVSHALIAQQMRFLKAPPGEQSHRDMQVIWSMRFEANPLSDLAGDEAWKLMVDAAGLSPDETRNRANAEVLIARKAIAGLASFPADKRQLVAGTAACLLRAHGENEDVLKFLAAYTPTGATAENWSSVVAETRAAITLERTYQELALGSIAEAIKATPGDTLVLTYLTAEIQRRMGRTAEARAAYLQVQGMPDQPDWLKPWLTEQLKLVS